MININQDLCVKCEMCIKDCAAFAIKNIDGNIVGPEECMECGHCVAICPRAAISMDGYDMSQVTEIPDNNIDAEELLRSIKSRRSIRDYKDKKIGEKEKAMLFEAIRYTATAKNTQQNKVVFVQERIEEYRSLLYGYLDEKLEGCDASTLDPGWAALNMFRLRHKANASDDYLLRNAPAMLVIANENPWDAGLAAQNVENMACALGMGVLYNGYMARVIDGSEKIKEWLGISGQKVTAAMLIGYPNVSYKRIVPRKPLDVNER